MRSLTVSLNTVLHRYSLFCVCVCVCVFCASTGSEGGPGSISAAVVGGRGPGDPGEPVCHQSPDREGDKVHDPQPAVRRAG